MAQPLRGERPDPPRRRVTAPTDRIVTGYIPNDLDALQAIATHYHGPKGDFAYTAFRWANQALFADRLPVSLLQWALTPFGKCLGMTLSAPARYPVITLHPSIWEAGPETEKWQPGPRLTLDTVIHECLHAYILYVIGQEKGHTSHDNPTWAAECMRVGLLLDLPPFTAAPTKRRWVDGSYTRATPEGALDMAVLARFPYLLRPAGYFQGTALPWD